ncbi:restriction endonuclease subunit S [Caballeronia grimmiae]|uniref:restriction endonuclease subunit S n=1 Tax=Caballeronia grimmiae TaxID=1071679 RepID=UPI0038BB397A
MSFESVFPLATLSEVATFINGDRSTNYPKPEDYVEGGIPFISAADLSGGIVQDLAVKRISSAAYERLRSGKIRNADILFCLRGSIGKIAFVHGDYAGAIASSLVILRTDSEKVDPLFLYFVLCGEAAQQAAASFNNGSAQPNLSVAQLQKIRIPMPSLDEQKGIVGILGNLDRRISLLRDANATLESIAQALFKSWFVDFDPVRAKADGRDPEGLDAETAGLFPSEYEHSDQGLIPKGWRVGTVADLGSVICGKTPPTSDADNYGSYTPFITIPDMHGMLVVTSTARSLSRKGADGQSKKYLPAGAVCVSCIATPGLVVRVTEESQTNQQINSVVPNSRWGKSFPLFALRRIGDQVRAGGSGGSVFHNLSKSGFERLRVLLTHEKLAQAFDGIAEPLIEKIIVNQQRAQTLTELRDALLPRLISGQLCLSDAETLLRDAA